jgi:hypothetical protein
MHQAISMRTSRIDSAPLCPTVFGRRVFMGKNDRGVEEESLPDIIDRLIRGSVDEGLLENGAGCGGEDRGMSIKLYLRQV